MTLIESAKRVPISIHAPLAGCDRLFIILLDFKLISIHAPLAGCDFARLDSDPGESISIHAPLAGCDQNRYY